MAKGKFPEPKDYPRRSIVGIAMTEIEKATLVEEAKKRKLTPSSFGLLLMRNGNLRDLTLKNFGDEASKMYDEDGIDEGTH